MYGCSPLPLYCPVELTFSPQGAPEPLRLGSGGRVVYPEEASALFRRKTNHRQLGQPLPTGDPIVTHRKKVFQKGLLRQEVFRENSVGPGIFS